MNLGYLKRRYGNQFIGRRCILRRHCLQLLISVISDLVLHFRRSTPFAIGSYLHTNGRVAQLENPYDFARDPDVTDARPVKENDYSSNPTSVKSAQNPFNLESSYSTTIFPDKELPRPISTSIPPPPPHRDNSRWHTIQYFRIIIEKLDDFYFTLNSSLTIDHYSKHIIDEIRKASLLDNCDIINTENPLVHIIWIAQHLRALAAQ